MTQVEFARQNKITDEMKTVARDEGVPVDFIQRGLIDGTIVIPKNNTRTRTSGENFKVVGIGKGLRTKVNANIGTSPDSISIEKELRKLDIAIKAGSDTVMDLSTGGQLFKILKTIISNSTIPVGTVPIYQAVCETVTKGKSIEDMEPEVLFSVIEQQCAEGVDFITVHCGVTEKNVKILKSSNRICGIVSRGGAFLSKWILSREEENPLYKDFDRLLDIAYKYDVALSLGDGLRPGAIADANDMAQIGELSVLGELVNRSRQRQVQVMVEGPGHMQIDKISDHVMLQKKLTSGAPFYLLGPLVTDIAPGFDHITSAIGGAIAAASGADFLCYVTPAEHLHLPDEEDVHQGVIASRIAGHSGDIVKGVRGAKEWDREFSIARGSLDWEKQKMLAIDGEKFKKEREKNRPSDEQVCTMCGQYCAMRQEVKGSGLNIQQKQKRTTTSIL